MGYVTQAFIEPTGQALYVCTVEDRPALSKLYLAAFPNATAEIMAKDLSDAEMNWWCALRGEDGNFKLALHVDKQNGTVLLALPAGQAESTEHQQGFLMLAGQVFEALKPFGFRCLRIAYPATLRKFGEAMERTGFLGKEVLILRELQFTDLNRIARVS